ncbi:response regulator transcription factor [Acidihalobacter aeolianus]|uniref:response regulator transcription factor n=1 Tax=Acidihalobacter aeolianus TaxID=2792603 RepID=UPI0012E9C77C|nr:helix-turn-helix transcriptional regulator [Acidihalobacter aeolianus]
MSAPAGYVFDASIQCLWDDLAEFPAWEVDRAFNTLLQFLCDDVGAQNVSWLLISHTRDEFQTKGTDLVVNASGYLHPPTDQRGCSAQQKAEANKLERVIARCVSFPKNWSAVRLADIHEAEWFGSAEFREHYLDCGLIDAIWCACPVWPHADVYLGIYRTGGLIPFSIRERDRCGYALRQLRWLYRRLMLSHCATANGSMMTHTERQVLNHLLAGDSEKIIAANLNQSPHTTHDHVKSIYRKFHIRNRAGLLSTWLSGSPVAHGSHHPRR